MEEAGVIAISNPSRSKPGGGAQSKHEARRRPGHWPAYNLAQIDCTGKNWGRAAPPGRGRWHWGKDSERAGWESRPWSLDVAWRPTEDRGPDTRKVRGYTPDGWGQKEVSRKDVWLESRGNAKEFWLYWVSGKIWKWAESIGGWERKREACQKALWRPQSNRSRYWIWTIDIFDGQWVWKLNPSWADSVQVQSVLFSKQKGNESNCNLRRLWNRW